MLLAFGWWAWDRIKGYFYHTDKTETKVTADLVLNDGKSVTPHTSHLVAAHTSHSVAAHAAPVAPPRPSLNTGDKVYYMTDKPFTF